MSELLKNALGAVVGLLGTLVVAFLGYRQWKKQQDVARYGAFLTDRQAAYKELWQKLEAVHLSIRSDAFREQTFQELVRAVNVHLIHTSLLLDPGEKKRVNAYMAALGELGRLLAKQPATAAKAVAQENLYDTSEIPRDVLQQVAGLSEAYLAVEKERELLIAQFRKVLGAHLFE